MILFKGISPEAEIFFVPIYISTAVMLNFQHVPSTSYQLLIGFYAEVLCHLSKFLPAFFFKYKFVWEVELMNQIMCLLTNYQLFSAF